MRRQRRWLTEEVKRITTIKKAVVTGATGGVGINLINELEANGIEVTAVCRPSSARANRIKQTPLVRIAECALADIGSLYGICKGGYDAFFHLAWDGTHGESRFDSELQRTNIDAALDAVRAANEMGCSVFVGAGSQAEFGPKDCVLSPSLECSPTTAYGEAKLEAGRRTRELCEKLGIRHAWCRILSLYGPYDGEHTMVTSVIKTLLKGQAPQCTAGDQIWDYIYAKDAARAFRLAAESGDGTYCIASGTSRTLKEFITAIRDAADPTIDINFGAIPYYADQVMRMQADISDLTRDTGFTPSYSFEDGIRETIQWVKENEQL